MSFRCKSMSGRLRTVLFFLCLLGMSAALASDVAIRAYINVSSGCQQPTVDFLRTLQARYAPHLSLEIIDFGDEGAGLKRWRQAGYGCMCIELNGTPYVKFPYKGQMRYLAFLMPAGARWEHADLEQAVQAALRGELRPATPQEAQAALAQRPLRASATLLSVHGQSYAAVKINGLLALSWPGTKNSQQALARAQAVALSLQRWLDESPQPADLRLQKSNTGWQIWTGSHKIITATAADVRASRQSAQKMARQWLNRLRNVIRKLQANS